MKKIFLFILVLIIQSCKNAESGNQSEIPASNKIEFEILSLLPSEYFEKGYSRAGYLEGDAQIFFTKDALNVSYLINGQSIMEKGTPLNIILTENNARKKILKGEWDNHTAGDGIFIVYLDKGNVCVQIEGQNGANWWYKAETKVSIKLYEKLKKLFNGNENKKEEIEMTDSIKVVFREKINENIRNKLLKQSEGRNINTEIFFGDIDNDGNQDAFIFYCVEPTDDDLNVGGGNAMMNMKCWESGIAAYLNKGNEFILKEIIDKYKLSNDGIIDFKAEKFENGKLICSYLKYADNDPSCCPSIKQTICLFLKNDLICKQNIN